MAKITHVLFDVGGVLHNENHDEVVDDLATELELEQKTLEAIWRDHIKLLGAGEIDEQTFWQRLHNEHGLRQVEVAENLLGRRFAQTLQPHVEVLALARQIQELGISCAILSNTIEPHARALREAGVYDGFDHVFLSHEVRLRKPDTAIFRHVLDELHATPEGTAFIDDRPENVEAATSLGIRAIHYSSSGQLVEDMQELIPALRR